MNASPNHRAVRRTIDGTAWVFLAEALILPTGLITSVFLTTRLGTSGYGAFTLAGTIIAWVEWTIASVFARPAIKFIGEAEDWRPVGSAVVRQYGFVSIIATCFVWILAKPISAILHEPALAKCLCLFAIDIPIFGLAQAHRNILIGLGSFRRRAVSGASRWIARLIFMIALVKAGLSVDGAVLASVLASCVELAVSRYFIRPSFRRGKQSIPSLWGYATPLLVSVLSLRLYEKLDLFALKALGATTAVAGVYGAAQNLAIIPGIFAMSFTPIVLATVSQLARSGGTEAARSFARNALRAVVLSLGLAAVVSGSASEIVALIYKADYAPAAVPLSNLILGAWGMIVVSTASAILIAYASPKVVLALTLPLAPVACLAHVLIIPHHHANGAAFVTGLTSITCAIASLIACGRVCHAAPSITTCVRSIIIATAAYVLAQAWPASGMMAVVKIAALSTGVMTAIPLTGELTRANWATLASFLPRRTPHAVTPEAV